ncbi:MAG TPA: malto-oligosyltrehalose trehalohydrolase [Acetobacteraceae bacterium]|nr:malto-oligosyltrehalose trehalohydrolase [Acetobacteraceae bacterium]
MNNRFAAAPRFGANLVAPDRARFALWAPDCDRVTLEVDGIIEISMRAEGGRFVAEATCGAGARYRFRVRPDLAVPDPAARAQAGDVHDASLIVDPRAYEWRHPDWYGRPWHEAVIYELHVGAMGGFAGVARLLPELVALGVTAIELMPISHFPGRRNWGYDGALPYAPATAYGTPDELKELVDAAHGFGLMVLLDVVYNHFGPDGNYLGTYARSFFRADAATPWGEAIDFGQSEVRSFFIDNALLWLMEYRFDGLRFDAVHAIGDRRFLVELANSVRDTVEPGRHVHLVLENDENDADLLRNGFDAQWSDDAHHALHVLLTGEQSGYYADYPKPAAALARALKEGFTYQGQPSRFRGGRRRGSPSGDLPPTSFVIFLQNHDQVGNRAFGERLTALTDPAALAAAKLLLLLAPQIPLLFMGEEWGETKPFLFFTDHREELAHLVREGRRREFSRFADFANPKARARIPDPNDPATFVSSIPAPASERTKAQETVRAFHARLLALRAAHIAPHLPGTRALGAEVLGISGVRAAWRLGNEAELTIAANFGPESVSCWPGKGELLASVPEAPLPSGCLPGRSAAAWLERRS